MGSSEGFDDEFQRMLFKAGVLCGKMLIRKRDLRIRRLTGRVEEAPEWIMHTKAGKRWIPRPGIVGISRRWSTI